MKLKVELIVFYISTLVTFWSETLFLILNYVLYLKRIVSSSPTCEFSNNRYVNRTCFCVLLMDWRGKCMPLPGSFSKNASKIFRQLRKPCKIYKV